MSGGRARIGAWRLWSLQGSWNRQGLQWLGWIVVWAPWLRRRLSDPDARGRWLVGEPTSSNTNPYLAGLLLGARMRVEEEEGPEVARRLSSALARTLGALGDGVVWAGARPALALAVMLGAPWAGAMGAAAAWACFAVAQGWLRRRCLEEGYRRGLGVADLLAHPRVHRIRAVLQRTTALLAGGVVVLVVSGRTLGHFEPGVALAGIGAFLLGSAAAWRRWRPEWALLGGVVVLAALGRTWVLVTGGAWPWP